MGTERGEVLTPTQKLIVRLQAIRTARSLTVQQVESMVNHAVSRSTLYRFFEDGAETRYTFDTFTIDAIRTALLLEDTMESGDAVAKEKVAGYEATIQQLKAQMEQMKAEYERRLELWQKQIEKKDERMDRKDNIIAEKDKEIHQLRERIDQLIDQLMERK